MSTIRPWAELFDNMGVSYARGKNTQWDRDKIIASLQAIANIEGTDWLTSQMIDAARALSGKTPTSKTLIAEFGSVRQAVEAADLEFVTTNKTFRTSQDIITALGKLAHIEELNVLTRAWIHEQMKKGLLPNPIKFRQMCGSFELACQLARLGYVSPSDTLIHPMSSVSPSSPRRDGASRPVASVSTGITPVARRLAAS
jgi:hypothetical protein